MTATLSAVDVAYLSKIGTGAGGGGISTTKIQDTETGLNIFGHTRFIPLPGSSDETVATFNYPIELSYKPTDASTSTVPISSTTICRKVKNLDENGNIKEAKISKATIGEDTVFEYTPANSVQTFSDTPAPNGPGKKTVEEICLSVDSIDFLNDGYDVLEKLKKQIIIHEDGLTFKGKTVFSENDYTLEDIDIAGFNGNVAFSYPNSDDQKISKTKHSFEICKFIDDNYWLNLVVCIDDNDKKLCYFNIIPHFLKDATFSIEGSTETTTITNEKNWSIRNC